MKKIILTTLILSTASLLLSACDLKDQLKSKIINKIDLNVQEEKAEVTPSPTDDQLLKEIDASSSVDVDKQFVDLQSEVK